MINSVEKTLCTLLFFFYCGVATCFKICSSPFQTEKGKRISTYCLETMTLFLCAFHAGYNRYKQFYNQRLTRSNKRLTAT